jgi:hypothetical protein
MRPLAALVNRFIDRTLPKAEWTHEAHLRVGTWHVHHHGLNEAMTLLRERIPRYNEAVGGVNSDTDGYHDTITWFYLVMIDDLIRRDGAGSSVEQLADLAAAAFDDRKFPFTYYTRDHLMSVAARLGIVEPNLRALPGAVTV